MTTRKYLEIRIFFPDPASPANSRSPRRFGRQLLLIVGASNGALLFSGPVRGALADQLAARRLVVLQFLGVRAAADPGSGLTLGYLAIGVGRLCGVGVAEGCPGDHIERKPSRLKEQETGRVSEEGQKNR
jgi:hypothetical protein